MGIDPGQTGGIGVLNEKAEVIFTDIMRDLDSFIEIMKKFVTKAEECRVFMEKAQPMPNNGVVGMFNYGLHNGELRGVLKALKVPYELLPPATWSKMIHVGSGDSRRPKEKSRIVIKRLFPGEDFTNPDIVRPRGIKKTHDGIMDAVLIAEYGRRKWVQDAKVYLDGSPSGRVDVCANL